MTQIYLAWALIGAITICVIGDKIYHIIKSKRVKKESIEYIKKYYMSAPDFCVYAFDWIYSHDIRKISNYNTEKVISTSLPHIDPKMSAQGMVVDITTDKGTYVMPHDTDTAYPLNKVITTDRTNILREVEAIKATSENALSQIETHKQTVTKCNTLISDLDPTQREKQQMEARFNSMESRFANIEALLNRLANR